MGIISKIKSKLTYTEVAPLIMDDKLRNAYQTSSVVGGCLKGRIAFVTGATSGIGLAIAERLLNEGCSVVISGRNVEKLDKAIAELKRRARIAPGAIIDKVKMDQYNPDDIKTCMNALFKKYSVSIVVNNAGIFGKKDQRGEFRSVTEQEYFSTIDVNLKSTILIAELAAKEFASKGRGNILNISSICAFSRNHYYTPYGISKTGITYFTKQLSEQYRDKGVIISSIAPGSVATVMNHSKVNDNISDTHPLRHVIIPEQIAALVAFMIGNVGVFLMGEVKKACSTEDV